MAISELSDYKISPSKLVHKPTQNVSDHVKYFYLIVPCRRTIRNMNLKYLSIFLFVAILAKNSSCEISNGETLWPPIGGDLISTIRIATKLCLGEISEEQAVEFWNCYNAAPPPTIDIIARCQTENFGFLFDSVANIKNGCKVLLKKFFPYAGCVDKGFTESGVEKASAFKAINICEAEVLGLK